MMGLDEVEYRAATKARWPDLEGLFASCGNARGCWCAYWYRSNKDWTNEFGDGNRLWFRSVVESGAGPGVLAYSDGQAVAWAGVAPRHLQTRLGRSRVLAAVDDREVWSLTCLVVAKEWRRRGLMRPLIAAAADHARAQGARTVEAYPIDPHRKLMSSELYVGTLAAFLDCGFVEVARRSPHRPIVRLEL